MSRHAGHTKDHERRARHALCATPMAMAPRTAGVIQTKRLNAPRWKTCRAFVTRNAVSVVMHETPIPPMCLTMASVRVGAGRRASRSCPRASSVPSSAKKTWRRCSG